MVAEADGPIEADVPLADGARSPAREKRARYLKLLALAVFVIGVLWAGYYFLVGSHYVSTDNAYVNAETAQVTPQISATVLAVDVRDTQTVKAGDVLVRLDPATMRIAVAQAQAEVAEARRRFRQTVAATGALASQVRARDADIAQARAQLAAAQADLDKARTDLGRRQRLAGSGAVSGEELTAARKSYASAQAAVATARAGIAQTQATRGAAEGELSANAALVRGSTEDTDPAVMAATARLEAAQLDLGHTVIRAPVAGVVTRRAVQVGERVTQGKPVMTIVPVDKVYVDANFKERQLARVRVGMPATVKSDLYGSDVVYHGRVAGLSGGTGASQSLIPAQNATGNWVKVVQRLPVRIELDPAELRAHPLRVGLSMEVEIDASGG